MKHLQDELRHTKAAAHISQRSPAYTASALRKSKVLSNTTISRPRTTLGEDFGGRTFFLRRLQVSHARDGPW